MSKSIVPLEKKILTASILLSVFFLALIAWAAFKYGVAVPGCVDDVKPFTQGSFEKKSENHYELHVVARMWSFDPATITVPAGSTVDVYVTSVDVNHGFHIDGTNVNLSAVPGEVNYARVKFMKPGEHRILCHEFCGVAHQNMYGVVKVVGENEVASTTEEALDSEEPAAASSPEPASPPQPAAASGDATNVALIEVGKKLFQEKACVACHSLDGAKLPGPTFKGLYDADVALKDGTIVKADNDYIKESIKEPQKKIVKGFELIPMPTVPLSDDEVEALRALIESVK